MYHCLLTMGSTISAAAVAVANRVAVGLDGLQQAVPLQLLDDPLAHLQPVLSFVVARVLVQSAVGVHDVDGGQAVSLADREVVVVVAGGDLQGAGAELGGHRLVGDDGDDAPDDGEDGAAADEVRVAVVFGVDGHGGVAEQGLGPRGGDRNGASAGEVVADVVEGGVFVAVLDLQVGEGGGATRAPVDDALAAVDEPLAVEVDEGGAHGQAGALVQRESTSRPVAGGAEPLDLLVDTVAVLVDPIPDRLDELLAAQLVPGYAVPGQHALYDDLGRYAGVVGARQV